MVREHRDSPAGLTINSSTGLISGTHDHAWLIEFRRAGNGFSLAPQNGHAISSITISAAGANNSLFSGNYAVLFNGFDSSGAVAIAGR